MTSEAQKRANAKWKSKNKDKQQVYRYRSQAKKFIREFATADDLDDLLLLINERRQQL